MESTHVPYIYHCLMDAVSDLIIKGEHLGQFQFLFGYLFLVLGNQFLEITHEVNTRILEGIDDWTDYVVNKQL